MHAEHAVGLRIGQDFHKAFGLLIGLGAAIGGERKFSGIVCDARGLQFLLGFPDRGDFRIGVNDVRNDVVIHVPRLPGEDFGDRDAFVFGFMSEHEPADGVADGINALHIGLEMIVHIDAAALIERDTGLFQAETFNVRHAPDADENDIGLDRFRRAAFGRLDLGFELFARCIDAGDFCAELEGHPLFFKQALRLPADFAVDTRQNALEEFHNRDLGAEPPPDRTELEPDHAGADHQ